MVLAEHPQNRDRNPDNNVVKFVPDELGRVGQWRDDWRAGSKNGLSKPNGAASKR